MDFSGPEYGLFRVFIIISYYYAGNFEVEIKKSRLTILILSGILKIKWGYSGLYSDNLDAIWRNSIPINANWPNWRTA